MYIFKIYLLTLVQSDLPINSKQLYYERCAFTLSSKPFPNNRAIFGLVILLFGLIFKSSAAYVLFIVVAIFAFLSMNTGGGAAKMVKEIPNINLGKETIKSHAQLAEKFAIASYVLGLISLIGLILNVKQNSSAKLVLF